MTWGKFARLLGFAGLLATLAACSSGPRAVTASKYNSVVSPQTGLAPGGRYKVGDPYKIEGVWYYPSEDYSYREEGVGSWYGAQFHGKPTANGERFDMNGISAAHRTLPLPSAVRVTNLDNGRQLNVRVNDRGPFSKNRIIDLSRRAAQLLGFERQGTARVRVEIKAADSMAIKSLAMRGKTGEMPRIASVPRRMVVATPLQAPPVTDSRPQIVGRSAPTPRQSPAPPVARRPASGGAGTPKTMTGEGAIAAIPPVATGPGVYIQAGAFANPINAQRLERELSVFGGAFVLQVTVGNRQMYRVRLGPVASEVEAEGLLGRMQSQGYDDARIVRY